MVLVRLFSRKFKISKRIYLLAYCLYIATSGSNAQATTLLSKQLSSIFQKSKKRIWIYSSDFNDRNLAKLLTSKKQKQLDVRIMTASPTPSKLQPRLPHRQAALPYKTTLISDRFVWQLNCPLTTAALRNKRCEIQKPSTSATVIYKKFLETWSRLPSTRPLSAQAYNYDKHPKPYRAPKGLPTKLPKETLLQRRQRLARQRQRTLKSSSQVVVPNVPFYQAPFSAESY